MSTESEVTKAPPKSAAERQANRRARINEALKSAAHDRYHVRSFNELWQQCAAAGLSFQINPHDLDADDPLGSACKLLKSGLAWHREEQKATPKPMTVTKAQKAKAKAKAKPETFKSGPRFGEAIGSATVAPTKGRALSRRQRARVEQ